jgi:heparin binding hemagglutinin HbhA
MAVSLPTSADVRKVRSQASKAVNTQFDAVKTPLLAWVGAGDLAVTKAGEAVDKAKARATERRALATERREKLQAQI